MKSKGKLTILVVLFAGVGLLMATTAFDTVEADRTAEVETAGDADALLGLEAGETALAENTDDGLLQITLDDEVEGEGLNQDATTIVEPEINPTRKFDGDIPGLFGVTNNGADEIEFGIQDFNAADGVDIEFITNEDDDAAAFGANNADGDNDPELIDGSYNLLKDDDGDGEPIHLDPGQTIDVGVAFDVGDLDDDGDIFADDTITLTADSR